MVTLQDTVDRRRLPRAGGRRDRAGRRDVQGRAQGEYSTVVQTFEVVLVDRELSVTADSTIEMNLADATVKPATSASRATTCGGRR